jgi:heme-degrading monooxygenase HmoA
MIYRVVTLHIRPDETRFFEDFFRRQKAHIEGFAGCQRAQLLRDTAQPATYYTLSEWNSEDDLNAYRASDFFAETWRITKSLFDDRAGAFSADPVA